MTAYCGIMGGNMRRGIHMKKDSAFITQAMLSSYLEVDKKDYLELILPFVGKCLPQRIGDKVNIEVLQSELGRNYGLPNIPVQVLKRLLNKLCKQKNKAYVSKSNNEYTVNKPYVSKDFDSRASRISQAISAVLNKMQCFMKDKQFGANNNIDTLRGYLSVFLDTYNYAVYDNIDSLNAVLLERKAESNYYVAQFILSEYESDSAEYKHILEIVKGSLIAKAIYYFMDTESASYNLKIKGTKFVLDTRVLINALGLDLKQEKIATRELLNLIISNGGTLVTYDYYVDELRGILKKYDKCPEARLTLSLSNLIGKRFSTYDIDAYIDTLEKRLAELKISVIPFTYCGENEVVPKWCVNSGELRDALNKGLDYRSRVDSEYADALIRDSDTIESVAYMRGPMRKCSVFDCTVIFVTSNAELCNVIYELYKDLRFKKGEVNFAITDFDLTSILWLSTFGTTSNLPEIKLIEHAYSACAPSLEVLNAFMDKVKDMEDAGEINHDTALLLRVRHSTPEDLTKVTCNDSSRVDSSTVLSVLQMGDKRIEENIKDRVKKEVTKEVVDTFKADREELDEARKELAVTTKILSDKEEALEAERVVVQIQQRAASVSMSKLNKLKEDTEFIKQEILSKKQKLYEDRQKLESEKMKVKKEKAQLKLFRESVVAQAKKEARLSQIIIVSILYLTAILSCIAVGVLFARCTWQITKLSDLSVKTAQLIVGVISVACTILSIVSVFTWMKSIIVKTGNKVNAWRYSKYMRKYKDMFIP